MPKADVAGKRLLGGRPELWVRWILDDPEVVVEEELSTEFGFVARLSDIVLKVRGREGPFLLLTEIQLRVDPSMPVRMRAYAALAEEKYRFPVYPVVFYLLPPGGDVALPESYHSEFRGITAHQDFRVIRVWQLDAKEVLERGITALIPLVPLMQGADEKLIRRGLELLRREKASEELEAVLALFASFVLDTETVRKLVRWDMAVLRESPWYREIVLEGSTRARQEDVLRVLQIRFSPGGETWEGLTRRIKQINDLEHLRTLLDEAVRAPSLEAFLAKLDGHGD